jgi:signal transduction histidine kinase
MKCGVYMKLTSIINLNKIWKKLAFSSVLTVLLTMLIMNLIIQKVNTYYGLIDFEADLESMINVAAHSLDEPLWNLNNETLVSICDSFFEKESVSRIVVKDLSLGVMYERMSDTLEHREDLLVTKVNGIFHNEKKIGSIEFTMTRYYIDQQNMRSSQIHLLEMLLIIFLLTLTLTVIISKITKPLSDLKLALENIADNNIDVPQIEIISNDEIADLSHSFNEMSYNIYDARKAINKLNEQLETKVELRTEELNLKNYELQESLKIINVTQQELLESNHDLSRTLRELQEIQDLLIESGKMALLGELVAGVAHEINTPIGVSLTMSSYIEVEARHLLTKVEENSLSKSDFMKFLSKLEESSNIVVRNLLRAGELITSFKQVAVDQTSHSVRKFNFRDYLNETLMNLQSQFKHRDIVINNECPEDLIIVSYPGAYAQVFTNLIMNSLIHAFDQDTEGVITINAEEIGNSLQVTFHDNGHGIAEEHINKIFNPFFTTKRDLGGTGLGLNITYNIAINILKGNIICQSEIDDGTTFILTVPFHHPDIDETLY